MGTAIISTLVAAFIIWGARRYFTRRRLYCIAPHVFEYSQLSARSNVAFIQLQNAGSQVESAVELALSPTFHYELIASTATEVEIQQPGLVRLQRLRSNEQVGLLFLVEGADSFRTEHVLGISSQEAKGKVVADAAQIEVSTPKALAIVATLFVVFGLGANVLFAVAKDLAWPTVREIVLPTKELAFFPACTNVFSNAPETSKKGITQDDLRALVVLSHEIKRVYRRGDYVYVDLKLKNPVEARAQYNVSVKTAARDSRTRDLSGPSDFVYDIVLLSKDDIRELTIGNFLPENVENKLFWLEIRGELDGGYWVNHDQRIYLDKAQADKCLAGEKNRGQSRLFRTARGGKQGSDLVRVPLG